MLARLPVVALKLAVLAPAATVTEAGTVKAAMLLERVMIAPPVGAAPLRVTVQAEVELEPKEVGEQVKLEIVPVAGAKTEIEPPVPEIAVPIPVGDDPAVPVMVRGATVPLAAVPSVTVAVATVPLPITVAFMPLATQVTDPLAAPQDTVLPAAVRAGPAAKLMEAMLPGA